MDLESVFPFSRVTSKHFAFHLQVQRGRFNQCLFTPSHSATYLPLKPISSPSLSLSLFLSLSLSFSLTLFSHSFEPADNNLVKICTAYHGCCRRVLWMRLPGQRSGASGIRKKRFTFFFPFSPPVHLLAEPWKTGRFKLLLTRQEGCARGKASLLIFRST